MSEKFHKLNIVILALGLLALLTAGCGSDDPTEPEIDTEAPTVNITNPANNAVISDTVTIVAEATDNVGVTRVVFTIDDQVFETDSASPWQCGWDARDYDNNSPHVVQATAYDAAGNDDVSNIVTMMCLHADETPPADIADLAVTLTTTEAITLSWAAPGDDGSEGTATAYDIRYHSETITDANWDAATACTDEPTPAIAGATESFVVTGLTSSTTYYFAMKTVDEEDNWSGLSNCISGATAEPGDVTAPAAITDLEATDSSATTITVGWTATGDDDATGTATYYDIRYASTEIDEAGWAAATMVDNEPTPQIAGSPETFVIPSLTAGETYYIAMKAADESGNWSDLSNCVAASCPLPSGTVDFPDPVLEAAIRLAISKPDGDIQASDLLGLIYLSVNGAGITDLTGLEYCLNLQELYLFNNAIVDVTPLVPLTKLEDIDLGMNDIVDICPLVDNAGLGSGDYLYIAYNPLSSASMVCVAELEARGVDVDTMK